MGELLLRGEQSEGDLRGRASRMDPIPDLESLRTHLDALATRGLVVWLSPPGRGRMLTHGLLPPETLEKVRSQVGLSATVAGQTTAPRGHDEHEAAGEDAAGVSPIMRDDRRAGVEQSTAALVDRVSGLERQLAKVLERLAALEAGENAH